MRALDSPLGIMGPGYKGTGDYFAKMVEELEANSEEYGCEHFHFRLYAPSESMSFVDQGLQSSVCLPGLILATALPPTRS